MGFVFLLFWMIAIIKNRKGKTAVLKYVLCSLISAGLQNIFSFHGGLLLAHVAIDVALLGSSTLWVDAHAILVAILSFCIRR